MAHLRKVSRSGLLTLEQNDLSGLVLFLVFFSLFPGFCFALSIENGELDFFFFIGILLLFLPYGIAVAIIRTIRKRLRYGKNNIDLSPRTGAAGGQVGARINLDIDYLRGRQWLVSLTCYHKDQYGRRKAQWSDTQAVPNHVSSQGYGIGTEFIVVFNPPADLPASSGSIIWELEWLTEDSITTDPSKVAIPVEQSNEASKFRNAPSLADYVSAPTSFHSKTSCGTSASFSEEEMLEAEETIERNIKIEHCAEKLTLHCKAINHFKLYAKGIIKWLLGLALSLFGVFVTPFFYQLAGWGVMLNLAVMACALGSLAYAFFAFQSIHTTITSAAITIEQRWLFFIKHVTEIPRNKIKRISISTGMSGTSKMGDEIISSYERCLVNVVDKNDKAHEISGLLPSRISAQLLRETVAALTGIDTV